MSEQPEKTETPEPILTAEAVRGLIVAGIAAAGAAPLADGVLGVIVPLATGVLGWGVSILLSVIARGKVTAKRKGVDVDQLVDELQRRSGPDAVDAPSFPGVSGH